MIIVILTAINILFLPPILIKFLWAMITIIQKGTIAI